MTPTKEQLTELLERVKAATGPDRELDAIIYADQCGYKLSYVGNGILVADKKGMSQEVWGYIDPGKNARNFTLSTGDSRVPHYTASIDTALALVERVLPGKKYRIGNETDSDAFSCLLADDTRGTNCITETAETQPLAILAALLTALIAQEENQ